MPFGLISIEVFQETHFLMNEKCQIQFCTSLVLTKSTSLIKLNPTIEDLDHIQNPSLSVPLPQTFRRFLQACFVTYSFSSEIASTRTKSKIKKKTASLVTQRVKTPPAMQETWVQFLGWEDPLEKGKAPHSSILAWRIPIDSPWGCKMSD